MSHDANRGAPLGETTISQLYIFKCNLVLRRSTIRWKVVQGLMAPSASFSLSDALVLTNKVDWSTPYA